MQKSMPEIFKLLVVFNSSFCAISNIVSVTVTGIYTVHVLLQEEELQHQMNRHQHSRLQMPETVINY